MHLTAERAVRESGLAWTFVRASGFTSPEAVLPADRVRAISVKRPFSRRRAMVFRMAAAEIQLLLDELSQAASDGFVGLSRDQHADHGRGGSMPTSDRIIAFHHLGDHLTT
jgi:hypothetical protein